VSTDSLNFGNQQVNTPSSLQVTITNSGNVLVPVSSIKIMQANNDFTEADNCSNGIAAGGNCKITVTFKPSQKGRINASLIVDDHPTPGPAIKQVVRLTGNGS
jgi:hypothetical protein